MNNLFAQSHSHWVRYDRYEIKTGKDGKRYITPENTAKPDVYNPLKESSEMVLEALNVGMLMMNRRSEDVTPEIQERLDYELNTIKNMGFVDYFLIVWDFIHYSREQGIVVGPGRGSAAGSIVAYSLEITNIDPLAFDLLFERFLNPESHPHSAS